MNEYLNKNLYEILGVAYDADVIAIKAAYRKKARIYHPDVNNNTQESIEKFKEITEAYEFLLNIEKRKRYDEINGYTKRRAQDSQAQRTRAKKAYSSSAADTKSSTVTKERPKNDEKSSFSSVFNTILDGLFPNEEENSRKDNGHCKPENGRDINLTVSIKISEALQGTHRTINVLHSEPCPKCNGRKFINGSKCPLCKGTGEISIHKKLNVKIPANVKNGAKIRIANEGNKGCNGGSDGDLYLNIEIQESKFFRYDGLNVLCEVPITSYEAALGATIEIPTLHSSVNMKIPSGTTTGQKFRLSGEGLSDGEKKGDQIVVVKIEMPHDITPEEKKLYERLKSLSRHNVRENLGNG